MEPLPVVMADLDGTALTDGDRAVLESPALGGLILFARNYRDPEQLRALVAEVRARRPELLLAVDQEGGRVQRFRDGFTRLPPMRILGHWYDREPGAALAATRALGGLMARELLDCGLDISFAPVLDLDHGHSAVIGDRAFHSRPGAVVALAGAWIRGMGEQGMAATGKHFPGHGHAAADSHHALPEDDRDLAEIRRTDLYPFTRLAGMLDGIMPAHLLYGRVDAQPAGFSSYWLRQVLRGELDYEGVIFSDDLAMEGAAGAGDYSARAAAALEAGCDMVLVCNDRPGALEVLSYLEREPRDVAVPASRLRARRARVPPPDAEAVGATARWLYEH